jgi:hypothetical protein
VTVQLLFSLSLWINEVIAIATAYVVCQKSKLQSDSFQQHKNYISVFKDKSFGRNLWYEQTDDKKISD